jgi:hypothetical protein
MNLLLSRQQKLASFSLIPLRIGSGVIFQLKGELELDDEEQALLIKYQFVDAPLVVSDPIDDLRQAFRPALLLGLVALLLFWTLASFKFGLTLAVIVTLSMTAVYFNTMREQIIVRDLLDGGRIFRCDSVVGLIRKEAYLQNICQYLRQVLESAKNWQNRERIAIQPLDKEEAKRMVLRGLVG